MFRSKFAPRLINILLIISIIFLPLLRLEGDAMLVIDYLNLDDTSISFQLLAYISVLTTLASIFINYQVLKVFFQFTSLKFDKSLILRTYLLAVFLTSLITLVITSFQFTLIVNALIRLALFTLVFILISIHTVYQQKARFIDLLILSSFTLLNALFTIASFLMQAIDARL